MCFGRRAPDVSVNLPTPEPEPVVKTPEPPKQLANEFRPLQPQQYQPGIQQAGSSQRRASGRTGTSLPRRSGLTTGIAMAGGTTPSGGINL